LALLLLELQELGEVDEEDLSRFYAGTDVWTQRELLSILAETKEEHYSDVAKEVFEQS
jgi:hypothetical protein